MTSDLIYRSERVTLWSSGGVRRTDNTILNRRTEFTPHNLDIQGPIRLVIRTHSVVSRSPWISVIFLNCPEEHPVNVEELHLWVKGPRYGKHTGNQTANKKSTIQNSKRICAVLSVERVCRYVEVGVPNRKYRRP